MARSKLSALIHQQLLHLLSQESEEQNNQLLAALRHLSKWRSVLIQNTLLNQQGTKVLNGPFAGMDFLPNSAEGCHIAKLLGCYEQPLHPFLERAIQQAHRVVLNIGCAEGYYAVGLSMRMPCAKVIAYDIQPSARETCRMLAAKNNVSDRVLVGERFEAKDFGKYADEDTLVICDIEGAEAKLLDPAVSPALLRMDLIVESHECLQPGLTQMLMNRFQSSHEVIVVEDNGQRQLARQPAWFIKLSHLDQLLAVWEWRGGPTPWLVMKRRGMLRLGIS